MAKRIFHLMAIPCVALGLAVSPMSFAEDGKANKAETIRQSDAVDDGASSDSQATPGEASEQDKPNPQDDRAGSVSEDGEAGFGSGAVGMPEEKVPGEQENDD